LTNKSTRAIIKKKERKYAMEKFIPTKHLAEDRMDRVVFIATTIGFGEILESFYVDDEHGKHYECVTSTGVIIVKGIDEKTVVTMYIARHNQIKRLYKDREIPRGLKAVVKRNEKKGWAGFSG
jgi:hypothetical protein